MKKIASLLLIGIFIVSAGSVALANSPFSTDSKKVTAQTVRPPVVTTSAPSSVTQPIQNKALSVAAVLPDFVCEIGDCTQNTEHTHVLCNTTDCNVAQTHEHNGTLYYGHHDSDGHDHQPAFICSLSGCVQTTEHSHALCGIDGCGNTETHEHNDTLYYGHHSEDGHGHSNGTGRGSGNGTPNASCPVSDCTQSGEHTHNSNSGHHGQGRGRNHN